MKIAIGADHGGLELKNFLCDSLSELGYEIIDKGTKTKESVDYPDIAKATCQEVLEGRADKAIVICGTGIGISIASNKIKGIRCALCSESYSARMAAQHNNANVLALGGRTLGPELALEIARSFFEHEFEAGRHERRVNKITALESEDF